MCSEKQLLPHACQHASHYQTRVELLNSDAANNSIALSVALHAVRHKPRNPDRATTTCSLSNYKAKDLTADVGATVQAVMCGNHCLLYLVGCPLIA